MRADIVVRLHRIGARADENDRIVEDVEGDVVADLGDILYPPRLQPGLAPQSVAFGAGIVGRKIGLDADRDRRFEFLGGDDRLALQAAGMFAHLKSSFVRTRRAEDRYDTPHATG